MMSAEENAEVGLRHHVVKAVSIVIPEDTWDSLKKLTASHGTSLETLVGFYIEEGLQDDWAGLHADQLQAVKVDIGDFREIIKEYAQYKPSHGEISTEVIFDEANDHYALIHTGWSGPYRIHGSVIHVDIRNDKIYIEHDGTEDGIANELVKKGIPKDRIVLAFKHPEMRPYTEYAVA